MAKLILVPTPIGNLEDITLRSLRVLKEASLILAEDTRTTGILLKHYDIKCPLKSYHIHNEHKQVDYICDKIEELDNVVLVSDAGTPAISDPGFLLVRACIARDIEVECLPGATALIPALVSSGLPADRFIFEGFLPPKKGRKTKIEQLSKEDRTIILYESPHRLLKTLNQFLEVCSPDRKIAVCRELTKLHEEIVRGTFSEVIQHFTEHSPRGEFVIVIEKNTIFALD